LTTELAPAATVRVAAWPLASIATFGRKNLEEERALLWERTAGDPRFLRALAIANPELARSLMGKHRPESRNKRTRHLETTLYRYLARAACRTEPGDMWTTATLATWGDERRILEREPRSGIAPDLAPFRFLVNALAVRAPYPERRPYKLNPTLTRKNDGSRLFWSPPGSQPSVQRRIGASAQVDTILDALATQPHWTRGAAAEAVATRAGVPFGSAKKTVDRLCEQGVLVGGPAFPKRFSDAWHALDEVEGWLEKEHAAAWRTARSNLTGIAGELGSVIDDDAAAIIAAMDAGRAELVALAQALEVTDFVPPRAAFRCDFESPWAIELGRDDARRLAESIGAYGLYERSEGLQRPLVDAAIALVAGEGLGAIALETGAADGITTWDAIVREPSELSRRWDRRREAIAQETPEATLSLPSDDGPAPRVAALHCSFGNGGLFVHGLALDATAAYARFASMLGSEGVLAQWFRLAHDRLCEHAGAAPIALLYDHATPNVLAQPALWRGFVDPWGVTPNALSDRQVELVREGSKLVVRIEGKGAILFAPTAGNPRPDDPCLHALLLSSRHAPPLTGGRIVYADEIASSRHRPRLRLGDGTIIQTRRTVLSGGELGDLLRLRGEARFHAWQELAAKYGWPELLSLDGGLTSPLVVHRDSILAIESAFEGARGLRALIVEEFVREAWVHGHVADLVVPYVEGMS
jgi:hypothetical protein